MFCTKCGNQLKEIDKFCTKCGNPKKIMENTLEKIEDNQIIFSIQPSVNYEYIVLRLLPWILLSIFTFLLFAIIFIASEEKIATIVCLVMLIATPLLMIIIKVIYDKQNYKHTVLELYKTKLVFKNTFLNKISREVKYSDIKEIEKLESVTERMCKIGTIKIFTTAEIGMSEYKGFYSESYGSEIIIHNIENVSKVKEKIEEIANI